MPPKKGDNLSAKNAAPVITMVQAAALAQKVQELKKITAELIQQRRQQDRVQQRVARKERRQNYLVNAVNNILGV